MSMLGKAGIVCDNYKVPSFEAGLLELGFKYTVGKHNDELTSIVVEYEDTSRLMMLKDLCEGLERGFQSIKN
jgi:hypothetical protein